MCAGILRSLGDSRTPLKAIVVSSVMNIVLNSVFIFICHSGSAVLLWQRSFPRRSAFISWEKQNVSPYQKQTLYPTKPCMAYS
ncbi:MAG: hypothetical protein OSJ72_19700 [Lachnospiraceae bacterium]|nr:hypothetical protein [Lachnospiraceae bacterium]